MNLTKAQIYEECKPIINTLLDGRSLTINLPFFDQNVVICMIYDILRRDPGYWTDREGYLIEHAQHTRQFAFLIDNRTQIINF